MIIDRWWFETLNGDCGCPFSNSHKNLPTIITWWTPSTFVVILDVSRNIIHVLLDMQMDVNNELTLKLFEQLLIKVRTQCAEFVICDS